MYRILTRQPGFFRIREMNERSFIFTGVFAACQEKTTSPLKNYRFRYSIKRTQRTATVQAAEYKNELNFMFIAGFRIRTVSYNIPFPTMTPDNLAPPVLTNISFYSNTSLLHYN